MQLTALIRCKALTLGALLMMSTGTIRADAIDDARRELQRYSADHPVTVGQSPGYYYRCFDAICELRSHYVEGRETQIRRQITTDTAVVYEAYRRRGETITLVDTGVDALPDNPRKTRRQTMFDHTAGPDAAKANCVTCDADKAVYLQIQRDIEQISEHWMAPETPHREGDFRISALGTMFHENCFKADRWKFDVLRADIDSSSQGGTCLRGGEEYFGDEGEGRITSTKYSLMPAWVDYYHREAWNTPVKPFYERSDGSVVSFNNCGELEAFSYRDHQFFQGKLDGECKVITDHGNRPKTFCAEELGFAIAKFYADEEEEDNLNYPNAYASVGQERPFVVTHQGNTRVYNGTSVVFKDNEDTRLWSDEHFQSVLFHERLHNIGALHEEDFPTSSDGGQAHTILHNEIAVACQATCFSNVPGYDFDFLKKNKIHDQCFDYEIDEAAFRKMGEFRTEMGYQGRGLANSSP